MSDITEFLLERLRDDEKNAERYLNLIPGGDLSPLFRRIRRDVWSKRQVVHLAWSDAESIEGEWGEGRNRHQMRQDGGFPSIVKVLAQVYVDHPDYDPAWS